MASSLSVKAGQSLEELASCCLGNTQPSRPKKGFVKYSWRSHRRAPRLIAAAAVFNSSISNNTSSIFPKKKRTVDKEEDGVSGKLDQLVKESVVEILNNLDEAPFLVYIYSDGEEASESSASSSKTRLAREKAAAESWHLIKGRWGTGESPTPSGIILVEEMSSEDAVAASPDGDINLGSSGMDNDSCSASTKVWGILIQGKGLSCPACYILKTCRVRSVSGFCTHFCLVRVKCFFESVDIQLKKLWLV